MDPIHVTVIVVCSILTILFVVLGIQVYHILQEIRLSIHKANKMLDDAGKVTGTVSEGFTSVSGFMNGIRTGLSMITSMKNKGEKHE